MARRSSLVRRSTGARPNRAWVVVNFATFSVIPAASKVLLGTLTPTNGGIDETVLRTVGGIGVRSDQAAASEDQIGAFGLIQVTDVAAAVGITAIPGPVTDGSDDGWFTYQAFAQSGDNSAAAGIQTVWYPIDSKAKRILEGTGMVMAIVAENFHATNGLSINVAMRLLAQVRGTR